MNQDKMYLINKLFNNKTIRTVWDKEEEKFGLEVEPYKSSEDAINKWITTVHAIGITKVNDEIKIYAPYGLSDIFNKVIRPIKHKYNTKDMYEQKANSWKKRFDNLTIITW